ncbi:MAG: thioredoxin [Chlorobi bacterium]|nr:thioredoxin [Chlorobiota bacterium]
MKRFYVLFLFALILSSCVFTKNKIVTDEKKHEKILIGDVNRKSFLKDEFKTWFEKNYSSYNPDKEVIDLLGNSDLYKDINIKIIFGTWCGDSRRELPRFFRIVDAAHIPENIISLTAVDTKKSSRNKSLDGISFTRIPVFIFYRNGEETGRIVESPRESLEKDILNILNK